MGRSRIAGARGKVRGAVGGAIYQIAKNGNGTLQQIVYARNRERKNNNTPEQARARMIMGQIQRMFHILPNIIRGAFDTIPNGAQCFWHFAKLNYPLLQSDFDNNFEGYGNFDFRPKYDMTAPAGSWILTDGVLPEVVPDIVSSSQFVPEEIGFEFDMKSQSATYGDLLRRIGMQRGDTLYVLFYRKDNGADNPLIETCSFRAKNEVPGDTLLNDMTEDEYFDYKGVLDCHQNFTFTDNHFNISIGDYSIDTPVRLACIAFLIYRPTDGYPLFSSSQFRWFNSEWWRYYETRKISQAYQNWCDTVINPDDPEPPTPQPSWREDYQEVEYIYNIKAAAFESNHLFNSKIHSVEMKVRWLEGFASYVWGDKSLLHTCCYCRRLEGYPDLFLFRFYRTNSRTYDIAVNPNQVDAIQKILYIPNDIGWQVFLDDTLVGAIEYNWPDNVNSFKPSLFLSNSASRKWEIYYLKIRDAITGELLQDLVPCIRKSDNVPGFYDTVAETFITSSDPLSQLAAGPNVE